jgi:hypothetical protein
MYFSFQIESRFFDWCLQRCLFLAHCHSSQNDSYQENKVKSTQFHAFIERQQTTTRRRTTLLELGAGKHIATVRSMSEALMAQLDDARLIRVNTNRRHAQCHSLAAADVNVATGDDHDDDDDHLSPRCVSLVLGGAQFFSLIEPMVFF